MADKVHFTQRLVQSLGASPGRASSDYRDDAARYLHLRVMASGVKTWYHVQRHGKRVVWTRIGPFPEIQPEAARRASMQIAAENAATRAGLPASITFGRLWHRYMDEHGNRARTAKELRRKHDRHLSHFDGRPASSLSRSEMAAFHARIAAEHGTSSANRLTAHVRSVYAWGMRLGLVEENPCTAVRLFPEPQRDRFLDAAEVRRLLAALDSWPNRDMADFILLALCTGARKGNLRAMAWADIDMDSAVWRIPGDASKNGQPMRVVLTAPALEVLARRLAAGGRGRWVFPAASGTGHMMYPDHAWRGIRDAAGLADVTIHDLRRTFGSWQAATGSSLLVIGKSLGHRSTSATQVYARLNLDPVRASVETAVAAMLKAAGKSEPPSGTGDPEGR